MEYRFHITTKTDGKRHLTVLLEELKNLHRNILSVSETPPKSKSRQ
jgi:hypothetical protein